MKKCEIRVGGIYTVKVSGRICPCAVEREVIWYNGRTHWVCRNLVTHRELMVMGAARFREVSNGS